MNEQIQAIVTIISLVNPGVCGVMFAQARAECPRREQWVDATRAALAILLILIAAALAGTRLLHLFGVSLDAFMVAGGGVLAWMGFSLISGRTDTPSSQAVPTDSEPSLTPLILFAASPGTITGVITISAAHSRLQFPTTALAAIVVAVLITWLVMPLVASLAGRKQHGGFVSDTVTRLMGLIVLSMGVQFALTGFHAFTA
jgi:multiple antibiotic resistance protein